MIPKITKKEIIEVPSNTTKKYLLLWIKAFQKAAVEKIDINMSLAQRIELPEGVEALEEDTNSLIEITICQIDNHYLDMFFYENGTCHLGLDISDNSSYKHLVKDVKQALSKTGIHLNKSNAFGYNFKTWHDGLRFIQIFMQDFSIIPKFGISPR